VNITARIGAHAFFPLGFYFIFRGEADKDLDLFVEFGIKGRTTLLKPGCLVVPTMR